MHKIIKIALVAVGLIGAALWFALPDSEMPASEAAQSGAMSAMFWITYLLLAVAVVFSFVFALKNLFSNPANLKKTLFVVAGFLVIVGISYAMSSSTDVSDTYMAVSDEGTVKKIGMGINVFVILLLVAVGAMLWGGVKKLTGK